MGTYGDEVYTTFRGLNIPEYVMEYESFSHFYWYFSCIRKQIIPGSIFRRLFL